VDDLFGQQLLHCLQGVPRGLCEVGQAAADKLTQKLSLPCYALLGIGYLVFGLWRTAPCGAIALLLHRTTPPVDLPCVRARTLVKMSLLFQRDLGPNNPGHRLSKFRQGPARAV
jgi:hypothetical protein